MKITINAVHPGIVKTGIIRDHKGFLTGMSLFQICTKLIEQLNLHQIRNKEGKIHLNANKKNMSVLFCFVN